MKCIIKSPLSESEFEKYYELRWEILRKPWNQPKGSEKDDKEAESFHIAAYNETNETIGVGRIHLNSSEEAQIRYMAAKFSGSGIGSKIVEALEEIARSQCAGYIILNARENAVNFYQKNGYVFTKKGPVLFGIKHYVMKKILNDPVK